MLIGNYSLAGSNRFTSHLIDESAASMENYPAVFTRCGLAVEGLTGEWEVLENSDKLEPNCKNCRRSLGLDKRKI